MGSGLNRRGLLRLIAGWLVSAAGAPSRARSSDADPIEVPLADIPPGAIVEVEWHGKPIFVRHRTGAEIARERAVPLADLRDPQSDEARARRPEWVVVEGVCTHGGCTPTGPLGDYGGWYCLCHGSQFDTAGRVRAGPARRNLEVPPHAFTDQLTLRLGDGS